MATPYSQDDLVLCQTCSTQKPGRAFPKHPRTGLPDPRECRACMKKREDIKRPRIGTLADLSPEFRAKMGIPDEPPTPQPVLPPAPPWLFYRDDMWRFVPAPPGSESLSRIEEDQNALRKYILHWSTPTTIPAEFAGHPHAHPCREWHHPTDWTKDGYGLVSVTMRHTFSSIKMGAHRARLFLRDGCLPPEEIQARHLCNNPPCVEVSHLTWGTAADNHRDRVVTLALEGLKQARAGNLPAALALEIRIAALVYGYDDEGIVRLTGLPPAEVDAIVASEVTFV